MIEMKEAFMRLVDRRFYASRFCTVGLHFRHVIVGIAGLVVILVVGEGVLGFYKFKKEEPYTITREDNGTWILSGEELEKLFRMTKFTTDEGILRFTRRLRKMGVDDKLEELGAQEGDIVRILDFEFEYRN